LLLFPPYLYVCLFILLLLFTSEELRLSGTDMRFTREINAHTAPWQSAFRLVPCEKGPRVELCEGGGPDIGDDDEISADRRRRRRCAS
jgi:hypothetical protein